MVLGMECGGGMRVLAFEGAGTQPHANHQALRQRNHNMQFVISAARSSIYLGARFLYKGVVSIRIRGLAVPSPLAHGRYRTLINPGHPTTIVSHLRLRRLAVVN